MPVGAAIGIGSAVSGIAGAVGASNAAATQNKAANRSADMQLGMFNTIRGDLAPYRGVGTSALPIYSALLGLPSGVSPGVSPGMAGGQAGSPDWTSYVNNNPDVLAAYNTIGKQQGTSLSDFGQWHWGTFGQNEFNAGDQNRVYTPYGPANYGAAAGGAAGGGASMGDTIQSALAATPGYQFTLNQGNQAIVNKMSASGLGGLSGSLGKGLARFVTGLADSTYEQRLKDYADAVGVGQSAANQTGAFGQTATTGAASALVGGANANAAGQLGVANAVGGIGQGMANGYLTSKIIGMYGQNDPWAAGPQI